MGKIQDHVTRLKRAYFRIPFLSANFHFSGFNVLKVISAPLRSKFGALRLGASGIGQMGTVQNYQMLAWAFGSLGLGTGLTADISQHVKARDQGAVDEALRVTFSVLVAAASINAIILFSTLKWFALKVGDTSFVTVLIPPILSMPFYSFGTCYLEPILYGHAHDRAAGRAYLISSTADLAAFFPLVYFFGVLGASIGILFAAIVHFSTLLYLVRKCCPSTKLFAFGFRKGIFYSLLKTGIVMLMSGIALYGVGLAIRAIIVRFLGETVNGHYQVVLALSSFYTPFITNAVWVRLYPQVGGHGLDENVMLEFTETLVYSATLACLAENFILIAPELVIRLLYSRDFLPAASVLPVRLIGDYGFLVSQPVLGVLLGLRARRWFLVLTVGVQVLFASFAYGLASFGLFGLGAAYGLAYTALLAVCLIWYFRQLRNRPTFSGLKVKIAILLIAPLFPLLLQWYLSYLHSPIYYHLIIFLGACLAFFLATRKHGLKELHGLRERTQ